MAQNLRRRREASGYSRKGLSLRIGRSEGYVALVESGRIQDPGASTLSQLARVLGCTVEQLGGGRDAGGAGPAKKRALARRRKVRQTPDQTYLLRGILRSDMEQAKERARMIGGWSVAELVRYWVKCFATGVEMPVTNGRWSEGDNGGQLYLLREISRIDMEVARKRAKDLEGSLSGLLRYWLKRFAAGVTMPIPQRQPSIPAQRQEPEL